ncbi:transposase, partial [Streptomyces sp. NPDC050164]|uniref:IS110 family transposase n=1 Tax=Streptomyces sp. NPDC050164 TaxID=3365605 RepID=UPI0037AFBB27
MSQRQAQVWVGIDAGKGHHWAAVVDETGATLWSKKIDNGESAILTALGEIMELADEVRWAVDIAGTSSAL